MIFQIEKNYKFNKPSVKQCICQIRYPNILKINEELPSEFQDKIKDKFPNVEILNEEQNQLFFQKNDNEEVVPQLFQNKVKNYKFSSKDETYIINLTGTFLAISTEKYNGWNNFFNLFNEIVKIFVEIYSPAYINRVGLRYINAFDKKAYGLKNNISWSSLFNSHILGLLNAPNIKNRVVNNQIQSELKLEKDSSSIRIISALANVKNSPNINIVLDTDSMINKITQFSELKDNLAYLHDESMGFYLSCLKEKMINLMEPENGNI